jgi:alpha-tubulin suppressor-like RCC1 family protein
MPTYDGTYKLAVEDGRVLIRDVEGGSQTTHVPLEIYSNYAAQGTLTDSRQLRLRTQPYLESNAANAYVTDMGIESKTDNYFFITAPQKTANAGDRSTFVISKTSNVGIGTTDPEKPLHVVGDSWVTGTLTASNIVGASPVTISSNLVMASGFTLTAGAIEPPAGSETTLKGGTTASITNSNAFPKFIFRSSSNVNQISQGGSDAGLNGLQGMYPDEDGKLWATGDNAVGVLGLGDTTDRNVFTLVSSLDGVANIVAVSTGGNGNTDQGTSRAIDDNGGLWTWGFNDVYQLGHGDTKNRYIPTKVTLGSITDVNVIEAWDSRGAMIALDSTGQLWGCGQGGNYRTGFGTADRTEFQETTPAESPGYTPSFIAVAGGYLCSLALDSTGNVWSTGYNADGATGQGTTVGDTQGFYQVDNTNGIESVDIVQIISGGNTTGRSASWALDSNGAMWNTGQNQYGQLGHGNTTNLDKFTKVTTGDVASATIIKVCYMYYSTIALDDEGNMWGCGRNYAGQLGQPTYENTITSFFKITEGPIADKTVTDIARVGDAVHAMTSDSELWGTGYNGRGSLGTGDTHNRYTFTKILDVNANPPPDYGYTRSLLLENTETGKGPSIELKNKNAVSSRIQMEDGASGKLNIGFVDASFDPKLSGGDGAELYPFQERAQSNTMTRGVTINQAGGTMVAGGSTSNVGFNTPVFTSGLPGSDMYGYADPGQLGYGLGTQLLITTEGKVYVAGDNIDGEAGDGTTSNVLLWTESTPPTTYGKIKAFVFGVKYSFVITDQAYMYRAGNNGAGQLGLNSATTPISTWTTDNARLISMSAGSSHTLGINAQDTAIRAAGIGSNYALGVGDATTGNNSNQIDFVISNSGAMFGGQTAKWVCAGRRQSYAIRSDDALVFVGENAQGLKGDGTTTGDSGSFVTIWTVIASSNFDSKTPRAVYLTGQENTREGAMMITTEGKIYGTGNNDRGQLGVGDTTDKTTWTAATGGIASQTVTRLALADRVTFALDSTGKVWSCGLAADTGQGLGSADADLTTFTKITIPAEFYSKTIVNIVGQARGIYAVDSEGTLWGTGKMLFGLGLAGNPVNESSIFTKIPIYDVVPKEFKYTPTLTLENPNADYGATVEFKNPNNRAFINLDDQTSTLRLGFVDNEDNAGQFNGIKLGMDSVAIGPNTGQSAQGTSSVAIGRNAGQSAQGTQSIAIGTNAGSSSQGVNSVAIGGFTGQSAQGDACVAIGYEAGSTSQALRGVAIGKGAGYSSQGSEGIAIGHVAGNSSQGVYSVAIGRLAGSSSQGVNSVAVGRECGQTTQGTYSVAIGYKSGNSSQGDFSVAIGTSPGEISQGDNCVAIGRLAGYTGQGGSSVAVGYAAGSTGQGINSVAMGYVSGYTGQGNYSVAIGNEAARNAQGYNSVAIGYLAGYTTQGVYSVAIGSHACQGRQYNQSVAIGFLAASTTQIHNCVAIGAYAARTYQHERSVVLNGTGVNLTTQTNDTTYMRPIRNTGGNQYMKYNSGSYEVSYYSSSDRRMKRNIYPVTTSAVEEISKLKVYTFEEKDNGIHPEKAETVWTPSVGVISQELYKNAPSMRHALYIPKDVGDIDSFVPPEDPNDPTMDWSVWGTETASLDYMKLVPHTMKAIQELNQEIINLKTRITELENASASG